VIAVRPRAEQQAVAVVTDRLPNVLVNAAPIAAKVALANILDNAVKFSPPGGQVRIAVTTVDDEAIIAVSDTGPGVSPDEAERLFQPFYRGKASRTTGMTGVGLGLAIARVLVQRQGGRISLDAPDQPGAKFSVHLPRAVRPAEPIASEAGRPPRTESRRSPSPTSSSAAPPRGAPTTDTD
jgi:two-component system, OmpR family, sensor kinase